MTIIRTFRDPNPGGGSGLSLEQIMGDGGTEPKLIEIDDPNETGIEPDGVTLKEGFVRHALTGQVYRDGNFKPTGDQGDGSPNPPPGTVEGLNADGTLKEGYIKDPAGQVIKDPNFKPAPAPGAITREQAVNPDGTLKEGFIQNADGSFAIDPNYEEDTSDEDGMRFISAIEAITGVKHEITYPDGVHPTSPEGIAHREKVIAEKAEEGFERYLIEKYPRAYALMLHTDAGKPESEFWQQGSKGLDLPKLEDMKASADLQSRVYSALLHSQGLSEAKVKILVEASIKANTLAEDAEAAHVELSSAQQKQIQALEDENRRATEKFQAEKNALIQQIASAVKSEIAFMIPEADQPRFNQFVMENLRYNNGEFLLLQPVKQDNLKVMLESLFFQYKKGDLKTLVTRQAATKAAQELRLRIKTPGKVPAGSSGGGNNGGGPLPLSHILPSQGS